MQYTVGIHGLTKLIADNAPHAIKEGKIENYFGRKIAIDASMSIYQFLIQVRLQGGEGQLTNENGEVTSHLSGMMYRTIRMMEAGIKPVFVFDGKPPTMKGGELAKRKERMKNAESELARLQQEGGSAEDIERYDASPSMCLFMAQGSSSATPLLASSHVIFVAPTGNRSALYAQPGNSLKR